MLKTSRDGGLLKLLARPSGGVALGKEQRSTPGKREANGELIVSDNTGTQETRPGWTGGWRSWCPKMALIHSTESRGAWNS